MPEDSLSLENNAEEKTAVSLIIQKRIKKNWLRSLKKEYICSYNLYSALWATHRYSITGQLLVKTAVLKDLRN